MSDNIKLIIEIPKEAKQAFDNAESNDLKGGYYDHGGIIGKAIQNGIPLDDVKAEIRDFKVIYDEYSQRQNDYCDGINFAKRYFLQILDNIGKESEVSK